MKLPDNTVGQLLWGKHCPLQDQVDVWLQERSRRGGVKSSSAWPRHKSHAPWLFHLRLPSQSNLNAIHWLWVIALWKIKQWTLNKKFFSSKFGAKIVNSIFGIKWGSIADGQCLNRDHMDLYEEKKIILSCKNAFGFHMGDMHPHVSVRWFCYKRLFLD